MLMLPNACLNYLVPSQPCPFLHLASLLSTTHDDSTHPQGQKLTDTPSYCVSSASQVVWLGTT